MNIIAFVTKAARSSTNKYKLNKTTTNVSLSKPTFFLLISKICKFLQPCSEVRTLQPSAILRVQLEYQKELHLLILTWWVTWLPYRVMLLCILPTAPSRTFPWRNTRARFPLCAALLMELARIRAVVEIASSGNSGLGNYSSRSFRIFLVGDLIHYRAA